MLASGTADLQTLLAAAGEAGVPFSGMEAKGGQAEVAANGIILPSAKDLEKYMSGGLADTAANIEQGIEQSRDKLGAQAGKYVQKNITLQAGAGYIRDQDRARAKREILVFEVPVGLFRGSEDLPPAVEGNRSGSELF